MKSANTILLVVVAVIATGFLFFVLGSKGKEGETATVSPSSGQEADMERQVMAGGEVSFGRPSDFSLAVSGEPIMKSSVIPPCDQSFEYCLYYGGSDYNGTNFESAGVRFGRKGNLETQKDCLNTPPDGYNITPTATSTTNSYATSVFSPLGDAAAGHYATGSLYRLWTGANCYEFETRIAESQFANYPEGTIKKFTDEDRTAVELKLESILKNVRIVGKEEEIIF